MLRTIETDLQRTTGAWQVWTLGVDRSLVFFFFYVFASSFVHILWHFLVFLFFTPFLLLSRLFLLVYHYHSPVPVDPTLIVSQVQMPVCGRSKRFASQGLQARKEAITSAPAGASSERWAGKLNRYSNNGYVHNSEHLANICGSQYRRALNDLHVMISLGVNIITLDS